MEKRKAPIKIDFTHITVPENLAHTRVRIIDIKEQFADVIYQRGTGIACHALALKIYKSTPDTGYDEREVQLILALVQQLLTPAVMDAIDDAIKVGQKDIEEGKG